jgi:hypothetical protein
VSDFRIDTILQGVQAFLSWNFLNERYSTVTAGRIAKHVSNHPFTHLGAQEIHQPDNDHNRPQRRAGLIVFKAINALAQVKANSPATNITRV